MPHHTPTKVISLGMIFWGWINNIIFCWLLLCSTLCVNPLVNCEPIFNYVNTLLFSVWMHNLTDRPARHALKLKLSNSKSATLEVRFTAHLNDQRKRNVKLVTWRASKAARKYLTLWKLLVWTHSNMRFCARPFRELQVLAHMICVIGTRRETLFITLFFEDGGGRKKETHAKVNGLFPRLSLIWKC